MTLDLLAPAATQVMYAAIEPLVPMRAVRAAVVAADTGAPRETPNRGGQPPLLQDKQACLGA